MTPDTDRTPCPRCPTVPEWLRLEMAAAEQDRLELLEIQAAVARVALTGSKE